LDLFQQAFQNPWKSDTLNTTTTKFIEALAACWLWVVGCLEAAKAPPAIIAYAARRAREVAVCGTQWRAFRCQGCGHDFKHSVIDGCDSRTCPLCGRKRSRRVVAAMLEFTKTHPVMRVVGKLSRDYYMHTFTEDKPEVLTLKGIRQSVKSVKAKARQMWEDLGSKLPREKDWPTKKQWLEAKAGFEEELRQVDGRLARLLAAIAEMPRGERSGPRAEAQRAYKAEVRRIKAARRALWLKHHNGFPGACPEAGMIVQVDMGTGANIHVHAMRYGAHQLSEDIHESAGATWHYDEAVRPRPEKMRDGKQETREDAIARAVCETVKYICKTTTLPGEHGFVHPMLAVLFELATGPDASGAHVRMTEGSGSMRGIIKRLEEKEEDEEVPEECPKCHSKGESIVKVEKTYRRPTMPNGGWCLRPPKVRGGQRGRPLPPPGVDPPCEVSYLDGPLGGQRFHEESPLDRPCGVPVTTDA
jgi:Zn finger protein HypA/HybF involved in hydrogenase expression